MRSLLVSFLILWFGLVMASANASSTEFPGRAEFPDIPVYELSKLKKSFNQVVIVDTRSKYEYDTLKIKGSIHIPVASKKFEQEVQKLRIRTDKPIVFYCNGRTCYKSYLAVKKSTVAGIKNTFAYDAGIFEWTKAQPEKSELLGRSPVNPKKLLDSKIYQARLLNPNEFSDRILSTGNRSMVLDVRDLYQRAGVGFYPGKERWVSLDDKAKLAKFLEKAKAKKKVLFIYDEVGKQVRWLQYALEEMGIKDYYFMDKGAKAYYASISRWK